MMKNCKMGIEQMESLPCVLFAALEEPISNIVIQIEIG